MEIGIRELNSSLSKVLVKVKNGESIVITERGTAIAKINPLLKSKPISVKERIGLILDSVHQISNPDEEKRIRKFKPVSTTGKPVSAIILEDRR